MKVLLREKWFFYKEDFQDVIKDSHEKTIVRRHEKLLMA